ncbi:hypothetical protein WK43_22350 [Burkholderia ubonensis]|nr:hypothetical protein WK37_28570 [Burkholderia ubonensis]KVS50249.1 hypothetical protein WK38_15310 [Burkholderia ubonensis]KVS70215.1 hypothetical protein WK42_28090 [Burkholderia ubonensis]KVS85400.1 hypothetical protein WK43_22350 [Burkholderia ubonensis]KVS85888.1 hypothetical protein WK44_21245 [Burkholderia ubonensis]
MTWFDQNTFEFGPGSVCGVMNRSRIATLRTVDGNHVLLYSPGVAPRKPLSVGALLDDSVARFGAVLAVMLKLRAPGGGSDATGGTWVVNVNVQAPPAGTVAPESVTVASLAASAPPHALLVKPSAVKPAGMPIVRPAAAGTVPVLASCSVALSVPPTDGERLARVNAAV